MELLIHKLKEHQKLTVGEIRELYQRRREWFEDISLPLARRALDSGENFYAYDIAEESVPYDDKEATQRLHIMALALARSGISGTCFRADEEFS